MTPSSLSSRVTKKDLKQALKQMVKQGDIVNDGKKYKLMLPTSKSSSSPSDESNSEDGGSKSSASVDDDDDDGSDELGEQEEATSIIPIAERIRKSTQKIKSNKQGDDDESKSKQPPVVDLDEEIRRLEAELAESDRDDDEDDEKVGSDYDNAGNEDSDDYGNSSIVQDDGIICLSSVADERIAPLPEGSLPQNKRRTLKSIDSGNDDGEVTKRKSKKSKRSSSISEEQHAINEGLKDAVNELLRNYVPSSHLKKPFYCRVCQHQSESESDFLSHKQSEFHKAAFEQEKKKTFCKLCRKQLTSILQMEEHLKSRPHREKMDYVISKQSGGGNRSRGHGRDSSGKQWC